MVNNIGKTSQTLSAELGATTSGVTYEQLTIISGELGVGFLLFDPVGTLGVVTDYTDETSFTVKTYALSIDVQNILNLSY